MSYFAAIDWGCFTHAACAVDEGGRIVLTLEVSYDAAGLRQLLGRFARLAAPQQLPVAIERPSGLLVDTLVAAGHPVLPVHPNLLKACRPRYRAAGGKSDAGDAFILADVLRTDGHRLRPLRPASDEIRALRALVRTRDDRVAQRVALVNQLHALLDAFWPGAAAIFADLAAPSGLVGPLEEQARGEAVLDFVAVLLPLLERIRTLSAAIEHAVGELPAGRILMSFPRAGRINAAQILAELGDDPARFPSEAQLAAEAGAAPVTHASGKSRAVVCRFACNKRLRLAITCFADNSRHASPWAAAVYPAARARGADHRHAVRILARAWIRVLWRCWQNHTLYEPTQHRAARPFLTAA